ncbi:hypothetical protein D3C78_883830 [compost metagenome]
MDPFSTKKSSFDSIIEESYDRPMGLSLVAILLVLGGAGLLIIQLIAFSKLEEMSSLINVSNYVLQGAFVFVGLLGVAAGVGTWIGAKWGWWLALFYFAYAVTRNINVLLTIHNLMDQFGGTIGEAVKGYFKYGVRVLWDCALLFYLCSETATTFFKAKETKKWKALLIVFAICIALFLVGTINYMKGTLLLFLVYFR